MSLRKGSFFEKANLTLKQMVLLAYMWLRHYPPAEIELQLKIGHAIMTDWSSFCREVLINNVIENSTKIGGPEKTVELNKSKFGKRKYN